MIRIRTRSRKDFESQQLLGLQSGTAMDLEDNKSKCECFIDDGMPYPVSVCSLIIEVMPCDV